MKNRNWPLYFAVAFVWTWGFWLVPVLAARGVLTLSFPQEFAILVAGACGPFVAAFVALYRDGGWRAMLDFALRAFRWRIGLLYLAAALFLAPAAAALAVFVHAHQGGSVFAFAMPLAQIPATFLMLFFLGGSVEEEFGWAYAIDGMQQRWGLLPSTLALGVVWGFWHLPLFFIAGLSQSFTPFWAFLILVISLRVLYVWVYESAGKSILASLLFHTSANLAYNLFDLLDHSSKSQPVYVYFVLFCAVPAACVALTAKCYRSSNSGGIEMRRV
jgi:uncharacterized protein